MDASGAVGGFESWHIVDSRLADDETGEAPDAKTALALYDEYVKLLRKYGLTGDDTRLRIRQDYSPIKLHPEDMTLYAETIDRYASMTALSVYRPISGFNEDVNFIASVHAYHSLVSGGWELLRYDYNGLLQPSRTN